MVKFERDRVKNNLYRERYLILLILISLYLSLLEAIIPKPFPWMKIGLANLGTIIALEKFDKRMAVEVVVFRIVIQGIMLGTLFSPGFIISLTSGLISFCIMVGLYIYREKLTLISISMFSALIHNLTQLVVVYILLFRNIEIRSRYIIFFILGFLMLGCISGLITGIIGEKLLIRRRKR
ncbi:MAG: Gx transporter family protein [Fusobacterium sp. JB021]|nr:Gx transporter family protein [Fusobacterium sp. JB021]MDP0505626.1 Gx transporter family protein [Fusobacterium sp. JB019]